MATQTINIFNFSPECKIDNWQTVNDGVMGGVSNSSIVLTEEGYGVFSGHVSLANNGGFASVQLPTNINVKNSKQEIILKVKGDEKTYQCRLKGARNQSESYVHEFKTTGKWQTVRLTLNDFYPKYRGRKLNAPNFNFEKIARFGFLIANKKEEDFNLLIDSVELK